MKITIALRGNKPEAQNLKLRYAHKNAMVYINTEITVNKAHFQDVQDKWVKSASADHATKNIMIRKKLNAVQDWCNKFYIEHEAYPTTKQVQSHFSGNLDVSAEKPTLSTLQRNFIKDITSRDNDSVSDARVDHYKVTFAKLQEFTGNNPFSLDDIDIKFYYAFKEFMRTKYGNGDNTINSNITRLKTFLYWCIDNKHTTLERNAIKNFKVKWVDRDIIFHRDDDLRKLFQVDLSHSQYLDRVRDAYLLQCTTGLRHSDIEADKWYIDNGFLKKMPNKTSKLTGKSITVHLRPETWDIIQKYKGGNLPFPEYENQPYNEAIKQVGLLAGITQEVTIVKGRKKFKPGQKMPKYLLMSSHVARATFICMLLRNNVSLADVMEMAGLTLDTLKHYAGAENESIRESSEKVYMQQGDLRVVHNAVKSA